MDRTNIHSNHIIETGVMRWTTTTVGGGCFVSKIEATKTDIWIIDGNGTRAHTPELKELGRAFISRGFFGSRHRLRVTFFKPTPGAPATIKCLLFPDGNRRRRRQQEEEMTKKKERKKFPSSWLTNGHEVTSQGGPDWFGRPLIPRVPVRGGANVWFPAGPMETPRPLCAPRDTIGETTPPRLSRSSTTTTTRTNR